MNRWILLLVVWLLAISACGPPQQGLVLTVKGLSREVVSLEVRATHEGRPRYVTVERDLARFGLQAPDGALGPLEIAISALSEDRCVVAQGGTTAILKGDRLDEVLVELRPIDAAECHAAARHESDGVIVVKASMGQGQVTSDIGGIDCGAFCSAPFARGTAVTLSARPTADSYFVRWLGACSGAALTCQVMVAGMAKVTAVFGRKHCLASKVCWESPLPQGNGLTAVWGFGSNEIWAVGLVGTVLHYDGFVWSNVLSSTTSDLYGVWGGAANDVWIVGDEVTLHWNGNALVTVPAGRGGRSVWGSSESDVWFVGFGGVQRWRGQELTDVSVGIDGIGAILAVWGFASNDVWFVGELGSILHWDGSTFTSIGGGGAVNFYGVWGLSADDLWIVGTAPASPPLTYRWNGYRLEPVVVPCRVAWGFKPETLWSVCRQRWTGTVWEPFNPGESRAVWGSADNDVWFVGDAGELQHWDGTTIESADSRVAYPNAIGGTSATDVWLTTSSGVLRWDGATFKAVPSDGASSVYRNFFGTSSGNIWAVGTSGSIARWNGATLGTITSGTTAVLNAGWAHSDSEAWVVGNSGTVLRWNGTSFGQVASGTTRALKGVWGSGPNNVWVVGDGGTVLHWDGSALAPISTGSAVNMFFVWGSAPDDVWLIGESTKLWRWTGAALERVDIGIKIAPLRAWMSGPNDIWVSSQGVVSRWDGKTLAPIFSGASQINGPIGPAPGRTGATFIWGAGPGSEVWAVSVGSSTILRYRP